MAFRLNCVSELYKNLGRFDAIVEFTEISIRDFIHQAQQIGDFDAFLQTKSHQHNICVNTVDQSVYRARISHSYILSVYQTAELFMHQFRDEHIDLYNNTWTLEDTKDNLLIKTIRKISAVNPATLHIGAHRISLFNYYRVVRNKYSHDRISEIRVGQEFQNINQFATQIQIDYPGLLAPNDFDNISFEDFILFSRAIKDIAYKLNDLVTPTNEQLRDYYIRKDFFKELNENPLRKTNALKGHMLSNFGIEDNQANLIINLLTVPLA
ncbi:MAG: hypothetical protein K0R51_80 [Cytophagaceae bacterium]|nr:hypothetical protein [Cytophagaceae bacterium]